MYSFQCPQIHVIIISLGVAFFLINLWFYKSSIFSPNKKVTLQQWKMELYKNSSAVQNVKGNLDRDGMADKIRIEVKSILKEGSWDRWIVAVSEAEENSKHTEDQKIDNDTSKCHLENLDPWNPFRSMESISRKPGKVHDCSKNKGPQMIFHTDHQSNLIFNGKVIRKDCCYQSISPPSACTPITQKTTKIPIKEQYSLIATKCKNIETYKQTFSLVKKFKKKLRPNLGTSYNVIVLGLEGVSLLQFIHSMPLSYDFLTKTLSAISLNGYSKISESTFANLIALQTGGHPTEKVFDQCEDFYDEFDRMDGYPFLFEKFSSKGFYTSYSDDNFKKDVFLSHCNYKSLWEKQNQPPTDYFLPNLANIMEKDNVSHSVCYGKQTSFSIFLDHIEKMAETFKDDRYFQFTWQQKISGSDPKSLVTADSLLLNTLTFLHTKGHLNDTVLILMSDQGLKYGKLRDTQQGQLENRNPMALIALPPTFSKRYPTAMKNLRSNANKLTTPYDVHETIKSFMDLTSIDDSLLKVREWELKNRGVSLFLPLSESRTCVTAGIPLHQCRCNTRLPFFENNELTMEAAYFMLRKINEIAQHNPRCSEIKGSSILASLRFELGGQDSFYEYGKPKISKVRVYHQHKQNLGLQITLKTKPCDVVFEASVVKLVDEDWLLSDEMSITNDISTMASHNKCSGIPDKLLGYCCCKK